MAKLRIASIMFMFSILAISWAKMAEAMNNYQQSDVNKPIIVKASNPTFRLLLKSTPGTGYSWFACGPYQGKFVTPLRHQLKKAKAEMPGSPSLDIWTFKAQPAAFNVPRIFKICLEYARAWNLKDATVMYYTVITQPKT